MLSTDYIVNRKEKYSAKCKGCIVVTRVYGTDKLGKPVDFTPRCHSDYCNICGLPKCRRLAKKWKVKHERRLHHVNLTLKFGDFQDKELQQTVYEAIKDAVQYKDESALFSPVRQWYKGRRHFHVVISSSLYFSRKRLKAIRDKYFRKYNVPITSMSTMGYDYEEYADSFIDYNLRTGDNKPRWRKVEYPPVNERWSLRM